MAEMMGHLDRTSGPRHGPSRLFPLSGPRQMTWYLWVCISSWMFINPLHFVEVVTKAQRGKVICSGPHSKLEAGLELELWSD